VIVNAQHRLCRWMVALILACAATITSCGGIGDTADWPVEATPTRTTASLPPTTDGSPVIDPRAKSPPAHRPRQLVVRHVPGHIEPVWMLQCSTTPNVHQLPSGED
jgi:hypothetical protein